MVDTVLRALYNAPIYNILKSDITVILLISFVVVRKEYKHTVNTKKSIKRSITESSYLWATEMAQ